MGRLLKYALVLALGIAIGAYIVLEPLSVEDILPDTAGRDAATARSEAAAPATPASIEEEQLEYAVAERLGSLEGWRAFLAAHPNGAYAQAARVEVERRVGANSDSTEEPAATRARSPTGNEQGSGLSQRLGSLASEAQSPTEKVERLLLAEKAPASGDPKASGAVPPETKAASEPASSVSSPSGDAAPPTDATVSHDASQEVKSADDAAPATGTDGAAGAQLAALAPDEICKRDEDRLAQLRVNPSSNELVRFANELGCQKLLPQVVSLMKSLAPAPPAAEISGATSPGAQAESETAHLAPPLAGADAPAQASDETCKQDEERLVRLRSSPSGAEALRFEKELGCEKLRPQLQRLMDSLEIGASAPQTAPDRPQSNPLHGQTCASERSTLDRLRQDPSAEAARLFWRDMQCEGLRPQVRLLLESLNIAPGSVGSAAAPSKAEARQAVSDAPPAMGVDPAACRREMAELNRLRATPDLDDAKRFSRTVTCDALRPQAARLLDSFGE
jgi:hypothetical protein